MWKLLWLWLAVGHAFLTPVRHVSRPVIMSGRAARETNAEAPDNNNNEDDETRPPNNNNNNNNNNKSKEDLVKAVGEQMKAGRSSDKDDSLLDRFNPFKAGQTLRKTIDDALGSMAGDRTSRYYLNDRLSEPLERNPLLERLEQDDFVPEVLVVGATGAVGRLVVRRLLLEGRFRVRVLVRDLYTKTLNLLGTGVTYCQGDLSNMDSLEYALTDVDKICFCASAPRPDEQDFQNRFEDFMKETLVQQEDEIAALQTQLDGTAIENDAEWEQLEQVLEVRARLAEQVDCLGMQNLVRAYQHVRHADYGTSQAAKRSLFKFQDRPEDFNLFAIDTGDDATTAVDNGKEYDDYNFEEEDEEAYEGEYAEYDAEYGGTTVESRRDASVKTQVQWLRNQFEHGVFVGKVPKDTGMGGGEAAIVSSRFRSREDPENGIDLSNGFAGFICRACADGGTYEAFIRTKSYYEDGVEYVCEFSTTTKPTGRNKSPNKFVTVRLPFENFKPVVRGSEKVDLASVPDFKGQDVRNIGFRYRSASNAFKSKLEPGKWSSFYLALCYVKLYRSQPEPEFVYLSDARIPPVVKSNMVRHEARQLVTAGGEDQGLRIFDDATLQTVTKDKMARSPEETYYKYRGEEILKSSGLSYAIVRVSGYNEVPSGEASTIELSHQNKEEAQQVSRAEAAQICAAALLDPNALNKSFYVSKKKGRSTSSDEDISSKFAALPRDEPV